jgi:hypothetical protein
MPAKIMMAPMTMASGPTTCWGDEIRVLEAAAEQAEQAEDE